MRVEGLGLTCGQLPWDMSVKRLTKVMLTMKKSKIFHESLMKLRNQCAVRLTANSSRKNRVKQASATSMASTNSGLKTRHNQCLAIRENLS